MASQERVIDVDELKRHNSKTECWIAVHSKVYDITNYLQLHPGGPAIILRHAGKDATAAYDEVHAPSIIEETLAPNQQMGILNQAEIVNLPEDQKSDMDKIEQKTNHTMEEDPNVKPDLLKIISVQDFEDVARKVLTPKAWAFYSSAANDLIAHRMNRDCFRRIMFRPRVLRDITHANTTCSILGSTSSVPFFVAPAAMARLAHKDGEMAIAKGCASEGIIQCISSNASFSLQSIVEAGMEGQPFFFQLYVNAEREKTTQLLQKVRSLGVKAIFVTVDAPVAGKREADERMAADVALSSGISGSQASNDKKGGGMGRLMGQYIDKRLRWEDLPWIIETSRLPVVVKGIQCAADARLAMEYGCQGIQLSNHGGRQLDTAPPSVLTLLELHALLPEIFDKLEVYVDGGVTRGSDVLKCLALGAKAVSIGRPFLYSLCYGQDGVEHLSQILKDELTTAMKLCGITDITQASPSLVNTADIEHMVPRKEEHPWISWRPKARI